MDLYHIITNYIQFQNIIKLVQCNRLTNIDIIDFHNVNNKYIFYINDTIISNYKNIKYLNAKYNNKITNINHLINLEILDIDGNYSKINNDDIKNCINIKE